MTMDKKVEIDKYAEHFVKDELPPENTLLWLIMKITWMGKVGHDLRIGYYSPKSETGWLDFEGNPLYEYKTEHSSFTVESWMIKPEMPKDERGFFLGKNQSPD